MAHRSIRGACGGSGKQFLHFFKALKLQENYERNKPIQ